MPREAGAPQEAATAAGEGDLTVRAPEEGPREVRALARALNETVAKLDVLLQSQQSFVADASHELRTPLTALRLRLENDGGLIRAFLRGPGFGSRRPRTARAPRIG